MAHQRRARRRVYNWNIFSGDFPAFAAGTVGEVFLTNTISRTIIRWRGELVVFMDSTSAPGKLARWGFGLLKRTEDSVGTTVTASPLSDGAAGFVVYEVGHVGYEEMVTDVIDVPMISGQRIVIDSKAMRRLRVNEQIQAVAENVTVTTATALNMAWAIRTLDIQD